MRLEDKQGVGERDQFVRNDADKHCGKRFPFAHALSCAKAGMVYAFRFQRNMRIHAGFGVLAVILGFVLGVDAASWTAIVLCIGIVFAAECLNTAIESIVDLVSPDYEELARRAKDCAAAAVLVCAIASLIVAAVVFLPRLGALLMG